MAPSTVSSWPTRRTSSRLPVEQQPPELGRLAAAEHLVAGLEGHLVASRGELRELALVEPRQQRKHPQLVDDHQTVAR